MSAEPLNRADAERGFALFDAGRYDEAAKTLRGVVQRGLAKDAQGMRVLVALGLALARSGRSKEGLARLRAAAKWPVGDANVAFDLAGAFVACDAPRDALEMSRRAVEADPSFADAHARLADLASVLGALDEAEAHYRHAIALEPRWAVPRLNLGTLLLRVGRIDEATAAYAAALALDPSEPEAANGLGAAALAAGRHDDAIALLSRAYREHPGHVATRLNLGRAYRNAGALDDAIALHRALVDDEPADADAWDALAIDLSLAGDAVAALAAMREASTRAPDRVDFHVHTANLLAETNELARAEEACRRALRLDANSALARWNLALIELARGDFERGWKDYEARWRCAEFPSPRRDFAVAPLKPGRPVAGLRVLVHAEQGFGDTLQFLRYVPLLEASGATVILEVPSPLVPLVARLAGRRTVVAQGAALPPFDAHVPMLSLPLVLRRFAPEAAGPVPYLAAAAEPPRARRRIGLAWAGSRAFSNDRRRSLRLAILGPLLERDDVEWIGLQREIPAADADAFASARARHPRLGDGVDAADFEDTARRLETIDLVLAVDTAVAHLAGAMGRPVWIALPFAPDFRWQLGRDDSPWYPTARLFRQPEPGAWERVVASLARALDEELASARRVERA